VKIFVIDADGADVAEFDDTPEGAVKAIEHAAELKRDHCLGEIIRGEKLKYAPPVDVSQLTTEHGSPLFSSAD
jgi:hypothetical protein